MVLTLKKVRVILHQQVHHKEIQGEDQELQEIMLLEQVGVALVEQVLVEQ